MLNSAIAHGLVRHLVGHELALYRTSSGIWLQSTVGCRVVYGRSRVELLHLTRWCICADEDSSRLLHYLLSLVLVLLDHFIVGLFILRLELFVNVVLLLVFIFVATALLTVNNLMLLMLAHLHGHRVLLEKRAN